MENAARAAYRKDVEENTLDLTAKEIIQKKYKTNNELSNVRLNPNQMSIAASEVNLRQKKSQHAPGDIDFCDPATFYRAQVCLPAKCTNDPDISHENKTKGRIHREKRYGKRGIEDIPNEKSFSKLWYEAQSTEGFTYYWHLESKVTSWEPPKEGFMTLREQEDEAKERLIQTEFLRQIEQEEMKKKAENFEEQRANAVREKSKEIRKQYNENNNSIKENREDVEVHEEKKYEIEIPYRRDYSIPEKIDPYGPWQTIEIKSAKGIDLQLPKKPIVQVIQPVLSEPFKHKAFAEKTIKKISTDISNDDGLPTTFKKRKFGNRNIRKRFDDD
ncbi:hypothetical protein PV327_011063 [Microctonus hyperodae]|uniref:WW domain-containing protein n=1 Tax=Microctonus hyperodae TaxID=165561 RepID=A0AA39C7R8_MICHY|nr:hypothetical protein PV327_011063 [Microctonus hyperodae]